MVKTFLKIRGAVVEAKNFLMKYRLKAVEQKHTLHLEKENNFT